MRSYLRGWIVLFGSVTLLLTAGCGVNSTFVYKTDEVVTGGQHLPLKVAVLPFADGTEDFTKRGGVLAPETLYYNLAKAGIGGTITALTPDLWAKSFADELTASADFRLVRFVYSPAELQDEEFYVEGTVEKATASGAWVNPNEFTLDLRALQRAGKMPVWEKKISRVWKVSPAIYEGCGPFSVQCMVDRHHKDTNRVMKEMFTEARVDLVRTLAHRSGNRSGDAGLPPGASTGAARNEGFVGIGLEVNIVNNTLTVAKVIQGAPALKAGLQAGDAILSIDGTSTADMAITDAVGRIRGGNGTSVTLSVARASWTSPRDFTIVRDTIRGGTSAPPALESVDQVIDRILQEN